MKKLILFLIIILLFSTVVMLNGCTNNNNTEAASQKVSKLSIDEIKKKYTDSKIKSIQNIGENYVIIESQQETYANRFDLYNLATGDIDIMPTMPEYVTLEKVENENYIVFLSSGKNSECIFAKAPYTIRCIRIKNDVNANDDFIALYEDKYLDLNYSIQLGSKEESQMSDINIGFDGIQVSFKAIEGKELDFYADATDIPPTKTSYDKSKKQFTLELDCKQLDKKFKTAEKIELTDNQYISAYEIRQKDNKIYVTLDLKDTASHYLFNIKRLPDDTPYLFVSFTKQ